MRRTNFAAVMRNTIYLQHDDYIVLFLALMLELLALPLPGELVMSYAGVLVFEGKMNWIISILLAWFENTKNYEEI